ncbi:MBL fold metallo-hydrolase [Candidatus Pacearchaeota archaeon]|nr:MBL fold metallo-hydrolase [Candidatus Pacearchaeota archaeon]
MMEVTALASGSSGNCFYVGNNNEAVLVDAGISAKQVYNRMEELGLDPGKLRGIFITHEHSDHIRGADVLARQLKIPIYATKKTLQNGMICSEKSLFRTIIAGKDIKIGRLSVESFSKSHKAADPVSYTIVGNKRVAVITDAGYACKNIQEHISNAHFLFIESNHDDKMLERGPYPAYLKRWISGDTGHLSNRQAALSVLECASAELQNMVLSHLSQTNNSPEVALETFHSLLKERTGFRAKIDVSDRERPTPLYVI